MRNTNGRNDTDDDTTMKFQTANLDRLEKCWYGFAIWLRVFSATGDVDLMGCKERNARCGVIGFAELRHLNDKEKAIQRDGFMSAVPAVYQSDLGRGRMAFLG